MAPLKQRTCVLGMMGLLASACPGDDSPSTSGDGSTVFVAPAQTGWFIAQRNTATTAADLDGDGDLELILGQ